MSLIVAGLVSQAPSAPHRWKQTPLSEAVRFHHLECARYLKEYRVEHPDQGREQEGQLGGWGGKVRV